MSKVARAASVLLAVVALGAAPASVGAQTDADDEQVRPPAKGVDGESSERESSEADRKYPPEVYDPAWARYREAFVHLAAGDRERAVRELEQLRAKYEGHPAALFAGPVLEELRKPTSEKTRAEKAAPEDGDEPTRKETGRTDRLGIERPTGLARAELVSFQTLHGIALGAETCVAVKCRDVRAVVSSMVLGGGAGLGLSLYLTRDGVTPGHALAINSGVEWGLWNAIALNFVTRNWQSGPANAVWPLMFGQVAGVGAGAGLWQAYHPNAGDVAFVNAGGIWSGALTSLFVTTADIPHSQPGLFGALLATTDLGGFGAAMFIRNHSISRGRVYVINTGGVLGGLLGVGTVVLVGGESVSSQLLAGSAMLGAGGGLALSTVLTRGWSVNEDARAARGSGPRLFVRPTDGGGLLSIGQRF